MNNVFLYKKKKELSSILVFSWHLFTRESRGKTPFLHDYFLQLFSF